MTKIPEQQQGAVVVDMKNVKIIVDIFAKVLTTLPQSGCNWTLAELSVAYFYLSHQLFAVTDTQGKEKVK
jgi:hypothetical protein